MPCKSDGGPALSDALPLLLFRGDWAAVLIAAGGDGPLVCGMNAYVSLAVAIVAEVIATSALKASDGFSKLLPSVLVVLGYGIAFYFLSLTLRTMPVGVAYAVWSGVGIVLISALGWVFFGQKLDPAALAGMALIVAGVLVINLLSKSAAH